jgi:hypothetical protein
MIQQLLAPTGLPLAVLFFVLGCTDRGEPEDDPSAAKSLVHRPGWVSGRENLRPKSLLPLRTDNSWGIGGA